MSHKILALGDPAHITLVGVELKGVCTVAWNVGPFTSKQWDEAIEWLRDNNYNFVFSVEAGQTRWLQKDGCFVSLFERLPSGAVQSCQLPKPKTTKGSKSDTNLQHPVGFHLMCECNGTWYSCHPGEAGNCCP